MIENTDETRNLKHKFISFGVAAIDVVTYVLHIANMVKMLLPYDPCCLCLSLRACLTRHFLPT
jgi:hypothetical protein